MIIILGYNTYNIGTSWNFQASPKRIVSGSADGTVRVWDMVCNLKQVCDDDRTWIISSNLHLNSLANTWMCELFF